MSEIFDPILSTIPKIQISASENNLQGQCSETVHHVGDYAYDTKELLGHGAYGSVYKGRRSFDGGQVALKRVPSGILKENEVGSPVKTKSPYIVDCLDVVTDQSSDMTYVVLELCDTDLRNFLSTYGHLSTENLDLVAKCLAEGYLTLRQNGVVHRDIKPENIMLKLDRTIEDLSDHETPSPKIGFVIGDSPSPASLGRHFSFKSQPSINVAKFGDFGCSRNDSGAVMQNLAGTLDYMAPEVGANIVESHSYDYSVDMWSIGVVLYECVHGRTPFEERQLCKLFLRATEGNFTGYQPPTAAAAPAACPEAYNLVIGGLLELDPRRRLMPEEFRDAVFGRPNNNLVKKLARTDSNAEENNKRKQRNASGGGNGILKKSNKMNNNKVRNSSSSVGGLLSRLLSFNVK